MQEKVATMTAQESQRRYIELTSKVIRMEILTNEEMLELMDLRERLGVQKAA